MSSAAAEMLAPANLGDAVKTNEWQLIQAAIQSTESRIEAAAKLGISPRTLRTPNDAFSVTLFGVIVDDCQHVGMRGLVFSSALINGSPNGQCRPDLFFRKKVLWPILAGARARLRPQGILVVEVGEIWEDVDARHPELPFTWLQFAHGGEGVFLLRREELPGGE